MCPERLPTEVALERFLTRVRAEVHDEIGFLGEGMMAELTHIGALVSGSTMRTVFTSHPEEPLWWGNNPYPQLSIRRVRSLGVKSAFTAVPKSLN